jgi:hypothetical protein
MTLQELAAKVTAVQRDTSAKRQADAWYALRRACERLCALDDAAGLAAVWHLVRGSLADDNPTNRYWAAVLARELAMRVGYEDSGTWRRALVITLMQSLDAAAAASSGDAGRSKGAVDAWAQAAQTAACVLEGRAAAALWAAYPSLASRAAAALSAGVALIAASSTGTRLRRGGARVDWRRRSGCSHAPCSPDSSRIPILNPPSPPMQTPRPTWRATARG